MPLLIACPSCKKPLSLGDDAAGRAGRCPACGSVFRVSPSVEGWGKLSTVVAAAPSSQTGPAPAPAPAAGAGAGAVPALIGPYQVRRVLGRGSFGVVYQAHDPQLKRDVAIKVLNLDAKASPQAVARFKREAVVLGQMDHENIVHVYQLGEHDGAQFIVSQFVPGQELSEVIPEGGLEPGRAAELVIQLLKALHYAHEMDVIHRDVKPANVRLTARGQLKLLDFGLAGWVGAASGRMTQDGSVMGTAFYMAPEQARGDLRAVGPAADQYSAGVVLYELLTGHPPFEGCPSISVLLHHVQHTVPPPPSELRPGLDPLLEEICVKALAKDPADRYPGCREFMEALQAWRETSGMPLAEPAPDEAPAPPPPPREKRSSAARKGTMVTHARRARTLEAPPADERDEPAGAPPWRPVLIIAGALVALVLLLGGGFAVWKLASTPDTHPSGIRGPIRTP
jgi:serine/threonine protein kinase